MVRTKLATALIALAALHSGAASAVGMGELSLGSSLNQPLEARIPLKEVGELSADQILVKIADLDAFDKAGVERSQFLSSLKFSVVVDKAGNGSIVITSDQPVVEPYLDFIVETRWPSGKILREYTVLLDLPVFTDQAPQRVAAAVSASSTQGNAEPRVSGPVMRDTEPTPVTQPASSVTPRPQDQQQSLPVSKEPGTYRVQNNDTMWKIAAKLKPSPYVTTQQTMLALLKKNPDAFINNNVNAIKAGYVLSLPSEAEANAVSHTAAKQEIRQQDRRWRGQDSQVAAKSKPQAATAPQLTGSSTAADSTATSSGDVKFSVSSAGEDLDAGDGDAAQLRESLRKAQEQSDKAALENSAMSQRVVAMEQQISTLKALIKLKNDQLAAIQAGEAVPAVPAEMDEAELLAQQTAEDDSTASGEENQNEDGAEEDTAAVTATATAKENKPVKSDASQPAPAAPEPLAPWYNNKQVWLLGGILALLALLVLWFRQRANQRDDTDDLSEFEEHAFAPIAEPNLDFSESESAGEEEEDDVFSSELDDKADVFAAVADLNFDDDQPTAEDEPSESESDITADESDVAVQPQMGDAAAEADIYAAYGRYDQAASLLQNAIVQDPQNSELRVKLIDIYLDTRNKPGFDNAYEGLVGLNDADAIARVKESMSALEGVSDWLNESGEGATDETLMDSAEDDGLSEVSLDDDFSFDLDDEPAMDAAGDGDVDFSLDLDEDDVEPVTDSAEAEPVTNLQEEPAASRAEQDELASLDVDLADLDFDFEAGSSETTEKPAAELEPLDFDLDTPASVQPETEEFAPAETSAEAASAPSTSLEAEFEGLHDDEEGDGSLNQVLAEADAEADGELFLELDSQADNSTETPSADGDDSAIEFDLDDLNLPEPEGPEEASSSPSLDSADDVTAAGDATASTDTGELNADEEFELDLDLSDDDVTDLSSEDDTWVTQSSSRSDAPEASESEDPSASAASLNVADFDASALDGSNAESTSDDALDLEDLVFDEFDADLEGDVDDGLLSDSDHVGTKLDLARAYVDMGDNEGARDILEEVLQEGSEQQQQDARALLEQL